MGDGANGNHGQVVIATNTEQENVIGHLREILVRRVLETIPNMFIVGLYTVKVKISDHNCFGRTKSKYGNAMKKLLFICHGKEYTNFCPNVVYGIREGQDKWA